jgi:nucleotide-binding universal stress UspA family protein
MVEIVRILCPVDFSDNSQLALDYALSLAVQHEAAVSVMHVLPEILADPDVYPYLSDPVLPSGQTRERAFEQLGKFVRRALELKLRVDVALEDGDIVDNVVEKAGKLPADLIVLGTHGRRGLARLLMGSVTERVLRHATKPVLSVSPNAAAPPKEGIPFKNVLCPIDFSPSSLKALDLALSVAGDEGTVTLLHVVEFYVDVAVGEAVAFDLDDVRERHRAQAVEKLEQTREDLPADARARTKLETATLESGAAYKEILRIAESDAADVIVMGVMGRSAADMLFFGSTTNHIVRAAHCPVLTVRAEE